MFLFSGHFNSKLVYWYCYWKSCIARATYRLVSYLLPLSPIRGRCLTIPITAETHVLYWNPPPVPSKLSFTPPLSCPAYSLLYNPIPIWYDLPPTSSPLNCSDIWRTGKLGILVGKSNGSPHSVWMISFTQKFYFTNLKKKECSFSLNKPWCSKPCTNPLF